ncbi:MAG: leucine-rich repeat domain-containing protein [Bacteroidaceae bacterium]|nr:leucine-rich repeat domain-containing protein [Bacteroidaceae bacterium]
MKRKHLLLSLLALLGSTTLRAYDALVDGIYYNISGNEAEVTYKDIVSDEYGTANVSGYSGFVNIPSSIIWNGETYTVTSIGKLAFYRSWYLESVTIGSSVERIGKFAFEDCEELESVTIGSGVKSIGEFAFDGCVRLGYIRIQDIAAWCGISFEKGSYDYWNLSSNPIYQAFQEEQIQSGAVIEYGRLAYINDDGTPEYYYTNLHDILEIPEGVTSIGDYAFYHWKSLYHLSIPSTVTSIGKYAFCDTFNDSQWAQWATYRIINIGSGVTSIGEGAFSQCSYLTDVYCYAENVPETASNTFSYSPISSATLHVPAASLEAYRTTAPWSGFGTIVAIHEYRNGICTMHDECSEHFQRPEQDADGFYMLYNVGNVEWISQQVADNNIDLDCKLMNDIDFENVVNLHSPIGPNDERKYNATFDGQGFRIKNMIINRPNTERQGFFGDLRGNPNSRGEGTVIKNLIIDKSCSITGALRTGGITGTGQNNAKEIIIMNCVNEAAITTTANNAGGITGGSTSDHPIWKITNCVNTGTITALGNANGEKESAGISGWLGDNANTRVTNCFNLGMVDGLDPEGRGLFRQSNSSTIGINSYDLSFNEEAYQYKDHDFTVEDIANGRLAYSLNVLAGAIVYWQTLGEDEYPMPFSTSKQVYLRGKLMCDGTPIEGGTYTNDPVEPVRPPHEYEDGSFYCINCGAISEDFCELVDDFYQLNNEMDVCWFAEFVKAGHVEVNAKLNADLDFSDYPEFAGIADRDHGFKGIFDGGFHTISNMDMSWRAEEDWVGFINFLNGGATVKNLRGDNTCFIAAHSNAGFIGGSTAPGDIFLKNIGFEGDVTCSVNGAGGVIGCNTGSQAIIHMTNCYSTGFIAGTNENGALSAWLGSSGAVITNCWSSAIVSGYQNTDKYLARFDNATFTNCYCVVPDPEIVPLQTTVVDYNDMENGSLCYNLNGDQENIAWYQTLGEDEFPTFMPGHLQVLFIDGSYVNGGVILINDETTSLSIASEESGKAVVFTHDFNGEWEALYLPFAIDYDDIKDDFDLAEIDGVVQNDQNNDGTPDITVLSIIGFKGQQTTPNKPYLIRAKNAGNQTIRFEDVTIYPTEELTFDCASFSTKYDFTGSYYTLNASALANRYVVQGGELVKGASSLAPCRWYMTATARNGAPLNLPNRIRIMPVEDVITGVEDLNANVKLRDSLFDLQGRKVTNPQKGIYIQNGKKILVK